MMGFAGASELDSGKRGNVLREAETILVREEPPIAPLYYYVGSTTTTRRRSKASTEAWKDAHPLNAIWIRCSIRRYHFWFIACTIFRATVDVYLFDYYGCETEFLTPLPHLPRVVAVPLLIRSPPAPPASPRERCRSGSLIRSPMASTGVKLRASKGGSGST